MQNTNKVGQPKLMTIAEKTEIKQTIRAMLMTGSKIDAMILSRQFKRLPQTIRNLQREVELEDAAPKEYTELTYETLWAIIGQLTAGVYLSNIVRQFNCTIDDVKRIIEEYSINHDEARQLRVILKQRFGNEWMVEAIKSARWQPASPVVPSP